MELTNRFWVAVPVEEAWTLLTDVEPIAPCLPGAQLTEVDGDEYRGVVRVKVGPVTAQNRGVAHFVERDAAARRAVLRAEGRETRGQGNAAATVTALLAPEGDGTEVSVLTDLVVTGKVAQFGRGVLADVSTKLLGQFAASLEAELAASPILPVARPAGTGSGSGSGPGAGAAPGTARRIDSAPAEPVDALGAAGAPVLRRLVPLAAAVAAVWLLLRLARRR